MITAEKIERTALRNLLHNEDYTRKVLPFLKPEYFEDRNERVVFSEIQKFISQYNKRPTKETLQIDLGKRKDLNEDDYKNDDKKEEKAGKNVVNAHVKHNGRRKCPER